MITLASSPKQHLRKHMQHSVHFFPKLQTLLLHQVSIIKLCYNFNTSVIQEDYFLRISSAKKGNYRIQRCYRIWVQYIYGVVYFIEIYRCFMTGILVCWHFEGQISYCVNYDIACHLFFWMTIWKRKPLGAFIIEIIYGFMKAKLFRTQYAKAISKTEYSNTLYIVG